MPVFWLHCDFLWHVCMLVGGIELDRLRGCPIFPTTTLLDVHTLQKIQIQMSPGKLIPSSAYRVAHMCIVCVLGKYYLLIMTPDHQRVCEQ